VDDRRAVEDEDGDLSLSLSESLLEEVASSLALATGSGGEDEDDSASGRQKKQLRQERIERNRLPNVRCLLSVTEGILMIFSVEMSAI
jgi:hypothetical protein